MTSPAILVSPGLSIPTMSPMPIATGPRFAPSLAASVAFVLLLPVLLGLGYWQVERGRTKARLLIHAAEQSRLAPLTVASHESFDSLPEQRRIQLRGEFLVDRQGLLDNQVRDGQVGLRRPHAASDRGSG